MTQDVRVLEPPVKDGVLSSHPLQYSTVILYPASCTCVHNAIVLRISEKRTAHAASVTLRTAYLRRLLFCCFEALSFWKDAHSNAEPIERKSSSPQRYSDSHTAAGWRRWKVHFHVSTWHHFWWTIPRHKAEEIEELSLQRRTRYWYVILFSLTFLAESCKSCWVF